MQGGAQGGLGARCLSPLLCSWHCQTSSPSLLGDQLEGSIVGIGGSTQNLEAGKPFRPCSLTLTLRSVPTFSLGPAAILMPLQGPSWLCPVCLTLYLTPHIFGCWAHPCRA